MLLKVRRSLSCQTRKESLLEGPDASTLSGQYDLYRHVVEVVIDRLGLRNLDWDVKGNKYTLRLENKTVVVTSYGFNVKVRRVEDTDTADEVRVRLTGTTNDDVVALYNAILEV